MADRDDSSKKRDGHVHKARTPNACTYHQSTCTWLRSKKIQVKEMKRFEHLKLLIFVNIVVSIAESKPLTSQLPLAV